VVINLEEYEILQHGSLNKLKSDLDAVKSNATQQSMDSLRESIDKLLKVFTMASQEMHEEEIETNAIHKKIKPLNDKVDQLIEQNQELARGLVVVADLVKQHIPKIESELHSLKIPKPKSSIPIDTPKSYDKGNKPPIDLTRSEDPFGDFDRPSAPYPNFSHTNQGPPHSSRQAHAPSSRSSFPSPPRAPNAPFPNPPSSLSSPGSDLPPFGDLDLGAPQPLPGFEEKPKKKSFLGKLFKK
jgi:hypothetical protein